MGIPGVRTGESNHLVVGARQFLQRETDRHFLWVPVLLCAGLLIYFSLQREPGWLVLTSCVAGAGLFAVAVGRWFDAGAVLAVLLVATGFVLGKVRTEFLMTPVLVKDTGVVALTGWVESVEIKSANRQRAVVRVVSLEPAGAGQVEKVRVSFSRKTLELLPGDYISFKARLFKPQWPVAPGAFDFARRDWFRGIGGSGFGFGEAVQDGSAVDIPADLAVLARIAWLRNKIASAARVHLDGEVGAFAVAVLTGMRGGLSKEAEEHLRAAGLAHLLAISGLHMGLVAFTLFWLVRALLALSAYAALRWPIKKIAAVAALLGGAVYLALSGGAVSTQRAYIMIGIMFLAVLADRPAISMRNVALAALVILLWRPESVLNVSFQMSFLAVVGLIALYEARSTARPGWLALSAADGWTVFLAKRWALYFAGVVLTTIVASVATSPVAAYHFNRVAVLGVIANLVAIPLMGALIMPMALIGTLLIPFGLEGIPFAVSGRGISVVLNTAEWTAGLSGAMRHVAAMPPVSLLLFVLGGLWMCLWNGPRRWAGIAIAVLGAAGTVTAERPDVLVEQEAKNVAIRTDQGFLVPVDARSARFAVERWLAADGDGATLAEAAARSGLVCDDAACVAVGRGGIKIAFVRHPSALWDECDEADIVVTAFSYRGACRRPRLVIDRSALHRHGAHAIHIGDDGIDVERVADRRGERPWSGAPPTQ